MPGQFHDAACALCPRQSSPTGEHVWPRWLLKTLDSGGPFTLQRGGKPILDRNDQPSKRATLTRVKLPLCKPCNKALSERFETRPVKSAVRRLVATKGDADLTAAEAVAVGEWLVKTWLFLCHPLAVFENTPFNGSPWEPADEDLYGWTVDGSPPPDGLSAWATRSRQAEPEDSAPRVVLLPSIVADGKEVTFRWFEAGLLGTLVALVYHPGWAIDHPLETEGTAARMWPRPSLEPVTFSEMPRVSTRDPTWREGPRLHFVDGAYDPARMPLLSASLSYCDFDLPGLLFGEGPPMGSDDGSASGPQRS